MKKTFKARNEYDFRRGKIRLLQLQKRPRIAPKNARFAKCERIPLIQKKKNNDSHSYNDRYSPSIPFFRPDDTGLSDNQIPNNACLKSRPVIVLFNVSFLKVSTPLPGI